MRLDSRSARSGVAGVAIVNSGKSARRVCSVMVLISSLEAVRECIAFTESIPPDNQDSPITSSNSFDLLDQTRNVDRTALSTDDRSHLDSIPGEE